MCVQLLPTSQKKVPGGWLVSPSFFMFCWEGRIFVLLPDRSEDGKPIPGFILSAVWPSPPLEQSLWLESRIVRLWEWPGLSPQNLPAMEAALALRACSLCSCAGPVLDLTFCCCHLKITNNCWMRALNFYFVLVLANYVAGPGVKAHYHLLSIVGKCWRGGSQQFWRVHFNLKGEVSGSPFGYRTSAYSSTSLPG